MNAFSQMAKKFNETKDIDKLLVGDKAQYLDVGTHDVSIKSVDSSKLEEKKYITIELANGEGKSIRTNQFIFNKEGDDFGFDFRKLLAALFTLPEDMSKTSEALKNFIMLAAKDPEACNIFTGMKMRVELEREKGREGKLLYNVKSTGDGQRVAVDSTTGEPIAGCPNFDDYKELREHMKHKTDYSQAQLRISKRSATDAESNIKILNTFVSSKKTTTPASAVKFS